MASKVPIYNSDGTSSGTADLPAAFDEPVRRELISRAAISDQSYLYQPKGSDPRAGLKTSARYRGRKEDYGSIKNHGIAMRPREVLPKGKFGKVRIIPGSVKGRRAHPPHIEKKLIEVMNKKEYALALRSAISATGNVKSVTTRGHKLPAKLVLPIVLDTTVEEKMSKTKQVSDLLLKLGLEVEMARAQKSHPRSGVGSRKGGARRSKTLLFVVGSHEAPLAHAARNIAGVDVVSVKHLRVLDLAPGAKAGRLTAFTKSALAAIAAKKVE